MGPGEDLRLWPSFMEVFDDLFQGLSKPGVTVDTGASKMGDPEWGPCMETHWLEDHGILNREIFYYFCSVQFQLSATQRGLATPAR